MLFYNFLFKSWNRMKCPGPEPGDGLSKPFFTDAETFPNCQINVPESADWSLLEDVLTVLGHYLYSLISKIYSSSAKTIGFTCLIFWIEKLETIHNHFALYTLWCILSVVIFTILHSSWISYLQSSSHIWSDVAV